MESFNSFMKGMQKDSNPLNQLKESYIDAHNIRLVNDVGSTSFSINNIKGNKFDITIPTTPAFSNIEITADEAIQTLTINGQVGASFNTTGMTPEGLYNYIINDGAYTLYQTQYDIYFGNSYIVISPRLIPNTTNYFNITMSQVGLGLTIEATYVEASLNPEIIGSAIIRDDIYLFVAADTATSFKDSRNPGGHSFESIPSDPSSLGQIWKYTYDKITLIGTLTLIYNNYLDFSTYYAIPPTAAIGRYENPRVQRIYWTDNYNRLRSLNVVDPNAIALDVSLLDITPSVDFDIPILTEIHEGGTVTMKIGAYQLAYRFKNTGGGVTNFSPLSNIVSVTNRNEAITTGGNNFADYAGAPFGTSALKTITWTINNVDIDYERIEAVVLIRETLTAPPTIYSFLDEPINNRELINITLNGDILNSTSTSPITFEEFLALGGAFTHAKTLGSKDNRLFVANVRNAASSLEFTRAGVLTKYDTRVYRHKNLTPTFDIIEAGSTNTYTTLDYDTIVEKSDAINPDHSLYRYKSDGTTLGGSGPNISYEFISVAVKSDTGDGSATISTFTLGVSDIYPFRHTEHDVTNSSPLDLNVFSSDNSNVDDLQEYPRTIPFTYNEDMKYPQYNAIYWGYQQNEIYRMGIQFYDKSGRPFFAEWIGDIKFPDILDICPITNNLYEDGTQTGILTYQKTFVGQRGGTGPYAAWITQLGIRFTINIPTELTEIISGYSLIRVKREEEDKTVIAEGIITSAGSNDNPNTYYAASPFRGAPTPFLDTYDLGTAEPAVCFFITPNLLDFSLTQPAAGHTLNVRKGFRSVLQPATNVGNQTKLGGAGDPYSMFRLYIEQSAPTASHLINQSLFLPVNGTGTALNGYTVINADDGGHSIGSACYFFTLDTPLTDYDNNFYKLYATIDRILTNQYGGNTYSSRSNNEYILCSHFRSVKQKSTDYNDYPKVFGGDCMNYHIDIQRAIKKWVGGTPPLLSSTFFFPSGACLNAGFRYGTFVNRALQNDNGTDASGTETYDYNNIFSAQNDIKTFFPKPDPFILNDEFDTRFYASEIKINGEFKDSWGVFLTSNYWDVEGINGPVNAMLILRDKMYFWQSRAFGVMQINPRSVVTDNNAVTNTDLQLGTGLPLQRHDYLSTEIGLQHQWGVTKSSYKLFWLDVNSRKFYTYSEGQSITPESDIKGMMSYFISNLKLQINDVDKPVYNDAAIGINGIRCVYDFKYNQVIFTISDNNNNREIGPDNEFTLVFDEALNCFTSFYSFTPKIYFTDGFRIFSTNPNKLDDIYIHDIGDYCKFYDVINKSSMKFAINDNFQYTKIFDNLMFDSQSTLFDISTQNNVNKNDDTWNTIRVANDYQNTDTQSLIYNTNIKRKERTWQLAIPRNRVLYIGSNSPNIYSAAELSSPLDKPFGERIRDKYITVELTYNNSNNYLLTTNNVRGLYRSSQR